MVKISKLAKSSESKGKNISYAFFKDQFENMPVEVKSNLTSVIDLGDFKGEANQIYVSYSASKRVLTLGLGDRDNTTSEKIRRAFGTLGSKIRELKIQSVAINLSELSDRMHLEAAIEGILLGNYRFTTFKTLDKDSKVQLDEVVFISSFSIFDEVLNYAQATVDGTLLVRELGNLPSNILTPTYLAEESKKLASQSISVKVLEKEEILKERMGLFEGVFKGSAHADPPKFIIMDYKPDKFSKTLILVGKAITFDSGGISLKPGENMGDMKFDMLGGGAVIGAMKAISQVKPENIRVIGLVPSTPNLPDAFSYRPGDILISRIGKTVEVTSTDAEGRMLLADALGYAQDYKPDLVFDFATLTGAIVVGLGSINAAFYLNEKSEQLNIKDLLFKCGRNTGDYVWQMPLDDEYFDQIKSSYADIKQTGGRPGGSITAAMFLKQFTDYPWVHFDIAGTSWTGSGNKGSNYKAQTGATGFGVRLIIDFIRNWK